MNMRYASRRRSRTLVSSEDELGVLRLHEVSKFCTMIGSAAVPIDGIYRELVIERVFYMQSIVPSFVTSSRCTCAVHKLKTEAIVQ